MTEFDNLNEEEIIKIDKMYTTNTKDVFLQKKLSNIEKTQKWLAVKNNTKTNKFKKREQVKIRNDPYKFKKIPVNMRQIILNLCNKNDISLQQLAVKSNIQLYIINRYINQNYILENYDLHILMKTLNFDLIQYIDNNDDDK
jgi:ribosome-binding protein aMBF1 (putative translation factor)